MGYLGNALKRSLNQAMRGQSFPELALYGCSQLSN